jgi:hypothetical protein
MLKGEENEEEREEGREKSGETGLLSSEEGRVLPKLSWVLTGLWCISA